MARIEVVMPQMGESITEGTIVKWHKKIGDAVKKDETLLDISTDKVDSEIPSPAAGVLAEIVVAEQQTVAVRTVIAYLETDAAAVQELQDSPPPVESVAVNEPLLVPATEHPEGRFYSPLVLSIAKVEGLPLAELEKVPGSGEGGRVSKKDILAYLATRGKARPKAPEVRVAAPPPAPPAAALATPQPAPVQQEVERIPMTPAGQKMAQHMVQSMQTSPHVAAVHEVDMTAVVQHRDAHAEEFERKEGFKLTFTPYIVHAVVEALKQYPLLNSSIEGSTIIRKKHINIGIAVASDSGLIVPVIKNAEEKDFAAIARGVHDLVARARSRKLVPGDVQGGTFTITNYGVFGTLIGTPIINQPQIAILGTGAIKKRVVAVGEAIGIRSMAYFTMSFDHRVVDGLLGGRFLDQVVKNLEGFWGTE
jgi:2-oxoglutarate dehydrogenase complex dihydrolipoamide succinyltransferase (E2) component